jgi:hypothetical protein
MVDEEVDGFPARVVSLELPVDRVCQRLELGYQIAISRDVRAARSAELNEGDLPSLLGIALEEPLDRAESLGDTLGVIDAVDADPDRDITKPELVAQFLALVGRACCRSAPASPTRAAR